MLPEATGTDAGLMSSSDKVKLNGIATGAEVNVQADWNETDNADDAFIQNKPALVTNLNSVTNVNAPTPADGDILEYDASNSEWINAQPAPNNKIEIDMTRFVSQNYRTMENFFSTGHGQSAKKLLIHDPEGPTGIEVLPIDKQGTGIKVYLKLLN